MIATKTKNRVEISLFAALIFLGVQFFRIPAGEQFIHFGNALVVVGVLLYGSRYGAVAASLGLAVFDMLNGYLLSVWVTVLESLIVCLVLHWVYEKGLKSDDRLVHLIGAGLSAALTKIVLNLFKYTLLGQAAGGLSLSASFLAALLKTSGTFGSALATVILVPLLYPLLKKIRQKGGSFSQNDLKHDKKH